MTRLSVNINKFATLRNSRGGNNPNVIKTAMDCERFGAQGITVHPRPDERHIRYQDVFDLSAVVKTEFNIEGYPDERFLRILQEVRPVQATLVPDLPTVLTSDSGWNTIKHQSFLQDVIAEIKSYDIRVSLFLDPEEKYIESAAMTGTDRIELYTEAYARNFLINPLSAIESYKRCAESAYRAGLGINAGHDLNLDNLAFFKQQVPHLEEVSIGHALVCDALWLGLENTIQLYRKQLE